MEGRQARLDNGKTTRVTVLYVSRGIPYSTEYVLLSSGPGSPAADQSHSQELGGFGASRRDGDEKCLSASVSHLLLHSFLPSRCFGRSKLKSSGSALASHEYRGR